MQVSSGACVKKDKVISSNNVGGVCANPAVSFINVDSCFMTTVANACSTMFYKDADGAVNFEIAARKHQESILSWTASKETLSTAKYI